MTLIPNSRLSDSLFNYRVMYRIFSFVTGLKSWVKCMEIFQKTYFLTYHRERKARRSKICFCLHQFQVDCWVWRMLHKSINYEKNIMHVWWYTLPQREREKYSVQIPFQFSHNFISSHSDHNNLNATFMISIILIYSNRFFSLLFWKLYR